MQTFRPNFDAPLTGPPSWFPGARPRNVERALKRIHPRLELHWSPKFECWEVWHERGGQKYPFYRHTDFNGHFLPAGHRLVQEVLKRSMGTQYGQESLRRRRKMGSGAGVGKEDMRNSGYDIDRLTWETQRLMGAM